MPRSPLTQPNPFPLTSNLGLIWDNMDWTNYLLSMLLLTDEIEP